MLKLLLFGELQPVLDFILVNKKFIDSFPFINSYDFNKWNSPIIQSYYVFGTPNMSLLNSIREILLLPNSVNQMDALVDWFLVKEILN
jgi:hypothetical protein